MKPPDVVTATVEVAVDPATAFAIFTEEIGRWWRPGPINWNDSKREHYTTQRGSKPDRTLFLLLN